MRSGDLMQSKWPLVLCLASRARLQHIVEFQRKVIEIGGYVHFILGT